MGKSGSTEGEILEEPKELVGGSVFGVGEGLGPELDDAGRDTAAFELEGTIVVVDVVDVGIADMFVALALSAPSPLPAFPGLPLAFTDTLGKKAHK